MNYQKTVAYLYSQLPVFQRDGAAALKPNLNNIITLCNALGNPEKGFKSVHIAGTNGKGSVSHMLASILQSAGYKVGLYTSPHLKDFRERIKIDGKMIPEKDVVAFVSQNQSIFSTLKPSFFEMTASLAFTHFASQKVDIAIIETGLGGRLDATNIINPILSVITNISKDHTAFLGNTLESIAAEKAGIIKMNTPVVIGETQRETHDVFIEKAKENSASIVFADKVYHVENSTQSAFLTMDAMTKDGMFLKELQCELLGTYQRKNIVTVLSAVDELRNLKYSISEDDCRKGVSSVVSQTGLLGRWQVLSKEPLTIADIGHNEEGIREVLEQIKNTSHSHLHFVLGVVNDKDLNGILSLLPKNASYYFCKANIPRALNADELYKEAKVRGLNGDVYLSVVQAIVAAKKNAAKDDLVFVGGSAFVVAEAI